MATRAERVADRAGRRTDRLTPLFGPRAHDWSDHFFWNGPYLEGRPPVGRATIEALRIDLPDRIEQRELSSEAGEDVFG